MRYYFTAKGTLYYNKIILSILYWIIMVILLAEHHPKNMGKNKASCSQIITKQTNVLLPARQMSYFLPDKCPTSCQTNVLLPARQMSYFLPDKCPTSCQTNVLLPARQMSYFLPDKFKTNLLPARQMLLPATNVARQMTC